MGRCKVVCGYVGGGIWEDVRLCVGMYEVAYGKM